MRHDSLDSVSQLMFIKEAMDKVISPSIKEGTLAQDQLISTLKQANLELATTPRETLNVARQEVEEANRDIAFHFQQQVQEHMKALQDAREQAEALKLLTQTETTHLQAKVKDVEHKLEESGRRHEEARRTTIAMNTTIEALQHDRDAALMQVEQLTNALGDPQDENAQIQQDKYRNAMSGINKLYARSNEIEDIIIKLEEHRTSAKMEDEQQLMQSNFEDISMATSNAQARVESLDGRISGYVIEKNGLRDRRIQILHSEYGIPRVSIDGSRKVDIAKLIKELVLPSGLTGKASWSMAQKLMANLQLFFRAFPAPFDAIIPSVWRIFNDVTTSGAHFQPTALEHIDGDQSLLVEYPHTHQPFREQNRLLYEILMTKDMVAVNTTRTQLDTGIDYHEAITSKAEVDDGCAVISSWIQRLCQYQMHDKRRILNIFLEGPGGYCSGSILQTNRKLQRAFLDAERLNVEIPFGEVIYQATRVLTQRPGCSAAFIQALGEKYLVCNDPKVARNCISELPGWLAKIEKVVSGFGSVKFDDHPSERARVAHADFSVAYDTYYEDGVAQINDADQDPSSKPTGFRVRDAPRDHMEQPRVRPTTGTCFVEGCSNSIEASVLKKIPRCTKCLGCLRKFSTQSHIVMQNGFKHFRNHKFAKADLSAMGIKVLVDGDTSVARQAKQVKPESTVEKQQEKAPTSTSTTPPPCQSGAQTQLPLHVVKEAL